MVDMSIVGIDGVLHPHAPIFRGRYLHSRDTIIVSVPTRPVLKRFRRELSEDVSFGIGTGTLLVVEQSSLENRPSGA